MLYTRYRVQNTGAAIAKEKKKKKELGYSSWSFQAFGCRACHSTKYLLSTYYILVNILGPVDSSVNKEKRERKQKTCSSKGYVVMDSVRETDNK